MLTDGRTDDGRKVITIAHPEQSSGELKMFTDKKIAKLGSIVLTPTPHSPISTLY